MQIGAVSVDGAQVGVVNLLDSATDTFVPDLNGYEPQGRADRTLGSQPGERSTSHHHGRGGSSPRHTSTPPKGDTFNGGPARPFRQGSAETDEAIRDAAQAHHLDVNTMRGIASIESSMNPSSNAHRRTQYKGLYQVGREEWDRFGNGGNIYSARDNAMATGRMFDANRSRFRAKFGRDPTDTELYLMHQQGLGFYTRGAMTNIGGNPYPGMRGPQTRESFEAGWGRELARRKAGFEAANPPKPKDVVFDPGSMPL